MGKINEIISRLSELTYSLMLNVFGKVRINNTPKLMTRIKPI
jgi:hypothetical protein